MRLVDRRPDIHAGLTGASRGFIMENLWRAERWGTGAWLIDMAEPRAVPLEKLVESVLALVAEDAEALGCTDEIAHARVIARAWLQRRPVGRGLRGGTKARGQRARGARCRDRLAREGDEWRGRRGIEPE